MINTNAEGNCRKDCRMVLEVASFPPQFTTLFFFDIVMPLFLILAPAFVFLLNTQNLPFVVFYTILVDFMCVYMIFNMFREQKNDLEKLRKRVRRARKAVNVVASDVYQLTPAETRRRLRRLSKKYSPQSGLSKMILRMVQDETIDALAGNQEFLVKEIEDLVLLYTSLANTKNWKGALAAILAYTKAHFSTSLSSVVLQCISDVLDVNDLHAYVQQSGEDTPIEKGWLSTLRSLSSNWKLATQNEGFDKMSKLLSLLVGAGLLKMSSINMDVQGLQLFSELSVPKHVSAFDIADAAMSTVMFFVEGGYESIMTGSLRPLLYGEHDMRKFDEDYLLCRKYADYVRPGNLSILAIDENDLEKLYTDTIDLGKRLMKTSRSPIVKKQVSDRLIKLQDLHNSFTQYRQTGGIRAKPYCIGIFGGSSVGKSTIGPLLMVSSLIYNNYRADDESIIVLNEHDKYMSNYKSSIQGVFLDDVGNTKSEFVETAPTVRILEMVNNVKMYANMAEADLKGKVSIEPKVVVCTTNIKDFCATTYSNEPVSIARRANYIVTAEVRPEFATNSMLDEKKVFDHYGDEMPQIPDLWLFHVEKAYPVPNKTKGKPATIGWKTLVWNCQELRNIDIYTLTRFTNADSKMHFAYQNKIVHNNRNLSQKLTFCETCKAQVDVCMCSVTTHSVGYIDSPHVDAPPAAPKKKNNRRFNYTKQAGIFSRPVSWDNLLTRLETFSDSYTSRILAWKPIDALFESRVGDYCFYMSLMYFERAFYYACTALMVLTLIVCGKLLPWTCIHFVMWCSFWLSVYIYYQCAHYRFLMRATRDIPLGSFLSRVEVSSKVKNLLKGCALLAALYYCCKRLRQTRELFNAQGMMHPTAYEIDTRDEDDITEKIKQEMNWANMSVTRLPVSQRSKTTTSADLKELVKKNLTFMSTVDKGKTYATDAFFVCSNVALIPHHAWRSDEMLCEFIRHDTKSIGGNFRSYVSRKHAVDLPNTDFSLVWVPNGGSWKNLVDFFPQIMPSANTPAELLWKNNEGAIVRSPTLFKPQEAYNGYRRFAGGYYTLNFNTKAGLCMSPLVSETKSPFFAGFHLGGIDGTPKGCAGTIIRSHIDAALKELEQKPAVLLSSSAGTMKGETYDTQFFESNEVHELSPLRKLPITDGKTPNIEVFGSCKGRVTYYSDVVTSHISKAVEKVCNVPNQWGRPKFRKGDPWLASLEHSSQPSHGMEGNLLTRAADDYLEPFKALLNDRHALREGTKPLTRMQTVCGIDGKKFVDKMPPNTSVGFPLSGPKRNHLTYLDPAAFEAFNCPAELDDMFWNEFEVAKEAYSQGERYYPVFKACLKDEPTKLSKDKVRVFQAAPIVLQMMTRMYFLPIARILSLFPALSECAVGVNCQGPDWSELSEHMRHFGKDRILAGDYSKYDLRMPAQVMFSAFRILIEIAKVCDYSESDIKIMTGIATDICYPVMAYNGDLIQHIGSNPSGQNLTVYINSVVNSLLFRCAFFAQQGVENPIKFSSVCKLMTYGDDVKGSVKPGYDQFNHLYVAEFFAQHDMKFTMPDKESTPTAFMRDEDADFLKRKNVYCPETKTTMGALDEDSIFKSLHSNLKSKANTKEKLAADNIDGALREWFNHGREVYEKRRQQMREVAEMTDISHICTLLDTDYDQQVERWMDRYVRGVDEPETVVEDDYACQAGEFCGDEFIPYAASIYEHCNGRSPAGHLDWEYPLPFLIIGLLVVYALHFAVAFDYLRIVVPHVNNYHKALFMFVFITKGPRAFLIDFVFTPAFSAVTMIFGIKMWLMLMES